MSGFPAGDACLDTERTARLLSSESGGGDGVWTQHGETRQTNNDAPPKRKTKVNRISVFVFLYIS